MPVCLGLYEALHTDLISLQHYAIGDYRCINLIFSYVVFKVMSDMYNSVTGAKDAMIGAVIGGVEKTRAAVNERITTVSQMVSSGVNMALSHSESWVDHYLPLSEKELGEH